MLKAHPKYPGVWVARIYTEGRKKDPKTGKACSKRETFIFEGKEAEALDWYRDLLQGATPNKEVPLAPTLAQAYPSFCEAYKNKSAKSTYDQFLITWERHLRPYFGSLRPHQLTPRLIEQYKKKRLADTYLPGKPGQLPEEDSLAEAKHRQPVKKVSINRELSNLSSLVTWMAKPENNMARPLPFKIQGFPPKQTKAPLPIVPTRTEMVMLLRRSERQYRPIFAFCYYTGLRKSEVLKLCGKDINMSQGYVIVKGKGEKQRIVPIHRKLRVYLRKRKTSGPLWTNPKTGEPFHDVKKALVRAATRAGIEQRVYLHLLRHSFGTHGIQDGINLRSLQILMGHSTSKVTEMYTTLAAEFLATEMDKLGGQPRQKKAGSSPRRKTAKSAKKTAA